MSDSFEVTASQNRPRAKWVKPAVRQLKAGAAEFGIDLEKDDGDTDTSAMDS